MAAGREGATAAASPNGDPAPVRADALREARWWAWQRASAAVLALCVLGHLAVMIHAVQGGLSAAEILGRTRGHWGFAGFYGVFVLACAVHVPLGLVNIAREWWGWPALAARWAAAAFALLLLVLGGRAVFAVFAGA
jgi:fumarate reductase subunit C